MRYCTNIFQTPGLDNFISACNRIKSSANYHPHLTDNEIMSLVMVDGRSRFSPTRSALVIQPAASTIYQLTPKIKGELYQIMLAGKFIDEIFGYPMWSINNSMIIFVNLNGDMSLHNRKHIEENNFSCPLTNITVEQILNYPAICPALESDIMTYRV